ncbi:MAG: RNA methyltransferase [Oceanospirillaceae bacterium]|nr:RNA methyltransferase [Oceanospirillaceae bacterium]
MYTEIKIVLVNTTHSGNIGAVARAMKNMGMTDLVLVDPKSFPSEEASARAAGADDVLSQATRVASLQEAIKDCELVFATSARARHIPWPIMDPREMAAVVGEAKKANPSKKLAIVFGREDRGLTNDELHLCQHHVCIPSVEAFSSLNIGSAVQVIAYELRMSFLAQNALPSPQWGTKWDAPLATQDQLDLLFSHLEQTVLKTGFLDPQKPRQLMTRVRRLIMRALPDSIEVNILRGILTSVDKSIKNISQSKKELDN